MRLPSDVVANSRRRRRTRYTMDNGATIDGPSPQGCDQLHDKIGLEKDLSDAVAPGHSAIVALVSDPGAVEIREALASLPERRTPTEKDWGRLARSWRPRLDAQIALLESLRDGLDQCIGCGCLSLKSCALLNPGDRAGAQGPGPRYLPLRNG